jgi:hypothetical protein
VTSSGLNVLCVENRFWSTITKCSAQALLIEQDAVDLDSLEELDQKFGIAVKVMALGWLTLGDGGHGLLIGPGGNGREPRLPFAVLAEQLDAVGRFLERRNSLGAHILLIRVGVGPAGAAMPDACDGWFGRHGHHPRKTV